MENVSYLVLHTCTNSDRSTTALKSIRDHTFPLYWVPAYKRLNKNGFPQSHTAVSLSPLSAPVGFIGDLKPILSFFLPSLLACENETSECCVRAGPERL